jgi:hypothetical protein
VLAAPTITVTGSINNKNTANPSRVWNVAVAPDLALDPTGTPLAVELGFRAIGGNIRTITTNPNPPVAPNPDGTPAATGGPVEFLNPGAPIWGWETLSDTDGDGTVETNGDDEPQGVQVGTGADGGQGFASVGTRVFTNANRQDLILITTDPSVTALEWAGRYNNDGSMAAVDAFVSGRIAQSQTGSPVAQNFHGYSGSLAAVGPANLRFLGDMNGSNNVTNADVVPFGNALFSRPAYVAANPHLNVLRGDINGSGTITNADVVPFGQILFNQGITGSGSLVGSAVPEPASFVLVGTVLAFLGGLRRRGR